MYKGLLFIKGDNSTVSQSTGLDLAAGRPTETYSAVYVTAAQFYTAPQKCPMIYKTLISSSVNNDSHKQKTISHCIRKFCNSNTLSVNSKSSNTFASLCGNSCGGCISSAIGEQ